MYLYVKTTRDEYELPVAVAENAHELAAIAGIKLQSARTIISKLKHGRLLNCKSWHVVEVEEEDGETVTV